MNNDSNNIIFLTNHSSEIIHDSFNQLTISAHEIYILDQCCDIDLFACN